MQNIIRRFAAATILLLVTGTIVMASVIRVPEDYPDLSQALSHAATLDTVLIGHGVFQGVDYLFNCCVGLSEFDGHPVRFAFRAVEVPVIPGAASEVFFFLNLRFGFPGCFALLDFPPEVFRLFRSG